MPADVPPAIRLFNCDFNWARWPPSESLPHGNVRPSLPEDWAGVDAQEYFNWHRQFGNNVVYCQAYCSSGLPATPFAHKVRDRIHAADAARFAFRNRSFEEGPPDKPETAADWVLANGAVRTRERASDGEWSLKLPAQEAGASQNDIARGFGCVWNCDPLLPLAVRPGCVAAYSVDMAVTGGKPLSAYLRLCQNANASGYQFWGVPLPRTASATFVRRQIAAVFAPVSTWAVPIRPAESSPIRTMPKGQSSWTTSPK